MNEITREMMLRRLDIEIENLGEIERRENRLNDELEKLYDEGKKVKAIIDALEADLK